VLNKRGFSAARMPDYAYKRAFFNAQADIVNCLDFKGRTDAVTV